METQQAKKRRKHTRTKQLENGSQSENSSACSDKCRPRSLTLQVVDDDFKDNDALNDGLEDWGVYMALVLAPAAHTVHYIIIILTEFILFKC